MEKRNLTCSSNAITCLYTGNNASFVYLSVLISAFFFFRRPKCDKNVQHCANNDSAAVSKLEEWKKNLCSNCKLHNGRKEKLYDSCKAEKDSLGYG